jgi:SAM-dependent methyltransferase
VATLRIAHHIAAGHTEIGKLASRTNADRDSLQRVLRHLVSKGVFIEPTPGEFGLNDAARALLEEPARIGFDLDGIGGRMAHAWGTMLSAVRNGKPAYAEVFGKEFWEDLEAHPRVAASFDELMGPGHGIPDARVLIDPADWSAIRTVVDVGGGTGALLAEILRSQPHVNGILVDLPRVVARSAEVFQAAQLAARVTVAAQSFFDPLPFGADLYILKSVLGDWPDDRATAILKRCAEAARPAGRVVVFTNAGPGEEASPDLLMMVLLGGRSRTIEELREMGHAAGLDIKAVGRQASGRVLVEYRPA